MTWTEKGPYGAAAPRNHENFRQRMQGSPEVHATPAGQEELLPKQFSTETKSVEETLDGESSQESKHENPSVKSPQSDMLPKPYDPSQDFDGQIQSSKRPKPIRLGDFINDDVKEAFVLGTYSCKYISLVDSPTANAQENANYALQEKLDRKGEDLKLKYKKQPGALYYLHDVLKKQEKL